jgi:23S rRNA (cytosine1962-C5)-methyltransferase
MLCSLFCTDKQVLNLFSYSGSFAFHTAKGGAKEVVLVEQSKNAIEYAQKNMYNSRNFNTLFEWIQEDVFQFLSGSELYDLVIPKPPPFARKKAGLPVALKGYSFLNTHAFSHLKEKGILFTFSCSHAVSKEVFLSALHDAAVKAGRNVRIIYELHSSPDHH